MSEISTPIHNMINAYLVGLRTPKEIKGPKLKVDHLVSKVSSAYEKVRNAIEYQEEHLIRRSAIERGIKRRWQSKKSADVIAKSLVLDLIRGRYLPNDNLSETTLEDVTKIINKYIHFANLLKHYIEDRQEKENIIFWMISFCACELEDLFSPNIKDRAMIAGMYEVFHEYIDFAKQKITSQEKDVQIYIAIMRALTKYDDTLISWNLFKQHHSNWLEIAEDEIDRIVKKISETKKQIIQELSHPIGEKIMRFMQKNSILFWIMQDIIEKHKGSSLQVFSDQGLLEKEIIAACENKYKTIRKKRIRATLRSFVYIFITKMMMALALELPYDLYFVDHTNYTPIAINVLFHPLLLFFVAMSTPMPKANNTQQIVKSIKAMVSTSKDSPLYQIKVFKPTKKYLMSVFYFLYLILFIISFGIIITILRKLNFNIVSGLLFIFFITVISFFGLKMRQMVRELILIKKKEGFISRIINFLSLPVLRAGRWLSSNIKSINLIVFIFDYIIERPFKKTMEVSEEFVEYVKEKEEEVY